MEKVVLDGDLWLALRERAIRFTGDESLREPVAAWREVVPSSLEEALRERQKADAAKLRHAMEDDRVFYRICFLDSDSRDAAISYLHQMGLIPDTRRFYRRLADWDKRSDNKGSYPEEPPKMSDDVLDRNVQYLRINRNLLDDPEQFSEDYIF